MDEKQLINSSGEGRVLIFSQFAGVGDVIFCQTIAQRFIKNGWHIVWPVLPVFVDGLNRAYPDIRFIDWRLPKINYNLKQIVDVFGSIVIPLRWTDQICKVPFKDCMKSKYIYFDSDWRDWRLHAMWHRNPKKEQELLHLINPSGEPFNIVNKNFQSDFRKQVAIGLHNGHRNIEMKMITGYSLFDWALAMEQAVEIHSVSTAILYLLEMLELKATLYMRQPVETSHANYEYICSDRIILHP